MIRLFSVIIFILGVVGCANKLMQYEKLDDLNKNQEFEKSVQILTPEVSSVSSESTIQSGNNQQTLSPAVKKEKTPPVQKKKKDIPAKTLEVLKHEPDIEDGSAFVGRRPIIDPFRVGETVVLDVKYLGLTAGFLTMRVDPFGIVNGKKSYGFVTSIQSYPAFSKMIYEVNDKAVTWMNFDTMTPEVFSLHVRESGQLKEGQAWFDQQNNKATYWEKKVTKKSGEESKKKEWDILPYSQNVFSAVYYMRLFPWEIGKEYSFRVADQEDNLVFKGKAVRKETLETENNGLLKTIVVKPEFEVKGIFKPVGDIYFWLTDDDRKLVVRIEAKIAIGTLVCELKNIAPGSP